MMKTMFNRRRLSAAAVGIAATALLVACGSSDDSTSDDHAAHDAHGHSHAPSAAATSVAPQTVAADVEFATMMIPHHSQAVEMADLVPSRTKNAWLTGFADEVKKAQQPEIDQMSAALKSWGKPVPSVDADHSGHQMEGMMTPDQMAGLEKLSGAEFDREWITMMIAHHRGAVAMAKTELAQGQNPDMRTLAQEIIDSQTGEIAELEKQLKG
ncbi:MAG: DUF305 domain-containing protein [Gordonia sp. (in: high G+C Gram-positive bacteria)]|uniref:DUF305 domain-containing protein n=1 Tax=Gordonia sp. (in: high G+C Gram-positive bacteria) TaxID=84139 RepID=UPI0039E712C7